MTSKKVVTIDFYADADVVFVFDREEETTKMRVSSQVLRSSCKTFHTMFGPNFAEGQQLDSKNPKEKALDDNVFAMKTICQVLHNKHEELPSKFNIDELQVLAEVIDKYDLGTSMRFALEDWLYPYYLNKVPDNERDQRLCAALRIAVELKIPKSFSYLTETLLHHCSASYYNLMDWAFKSTDNWKMLNDLTAARTRLRNEVLNLILSYPQTNNYGDCSCASSYFGGFAVHATNAGIIPRQMDANDLHETFFSVLTLPEPVSRPCGNCGTDAAGGWGTRTPFSSTNLRSNLMGSILNLQNNIKGLCFYCVYEPDLNKRQCSCAGGNDNGENDEGDGEDAY